MINIKIKIMYKHMGVKLRRPVSKIQESLILEANYSAEEKEWLRQLTELKGHQHHLKAGAAQMAREHGGFDGIEVTANNRAATITFKDGTKSMLFRGDNDKYVMSEPTKPEDFTPQNIVQDGEVKNAVVVDDGSQVPAVKPVVPKPKPATTPDPKPTPAKPDTPAEQPTEPTEPTTPETPETPETPSGSNWWDFFGSKEFLIGVAAVTAVAGIIAAIQAMGNTIKARFRKTAKVLYNLQKDFGTSPNGLDMDHAMKGIGFKIIDFFTKMFGHGEKGKGAIGLRPFVDNYRNEIKRDYESAKKSWNIVGVAGAAGDQPDGNIPPQQSESAQPVYNSFFEAAQAGKLFESDGQAITESMTIGAVMAGITLGRLAYRGGKYLWTKFGADGKKAETTQIGVTKQSTREICWSIMNAFFVKYFNCEGVAKKLGMDINSLGDIDTSNVDKFAKLVQALKEEQSDNKQVSIMYKRVKEQYDKMTGRYFKIADTLVNNFEKYSKLQKTKDGKQLSEKDSNLLTSGTEKLRAELDRQKDLYNNNFYRVVNAIVTSEEYISYIDFIIEDVIPVFKSGLASDADYVLDVMPKKGEVYLITQTNQQQSGDPQLNEPENSRGKGNVALAEITDFDSQDPKKPIVKFKLRAMLIGDGIWDSLVDDGSGKYDLSNLTDDNYDFKAYAKDVNADKPEYEEKILPFNKWAALDPWPAINSKIDTKPAGEENVGDAIEYTRPTENGGEELLFILPAPETKTEQTAQNYSPDKQINEAGEKQEQNQESIDNNQQEKVKTVIFVKKDSNGNIESSNIDTSKASDITTNSIDTTFTADQFKFTKKEQVNPEDVNKAEQQGESNPNEADNIEKLKEIVSGNKEEEENKSPIDEEEKQIPQYSQNIISNINNITQNILANNKPINKETFNKIFTFIQDGQQFTLNKTNDTTYLEYTYGKIVFKGNYYIIKTSLTYNNNPVEIGYTLLASGQNMIGKEFINNYLTNQNQEITIGRGISFAVGLCTIVNNKIISFRTTHLENNNIQERLKELLEDYKSIINKQEQTSDNNIQNNSSESIVYSLASELHESSNSVSINKKFSNNQYEGMYVLTESCWGDGAIKNPTQYVETLNNQILESSKTYSDIAYYSKRNKDISFVPFNESITSKVNMPYNRYGVLTNGCPLFECITIIKFDTTEEKNIEKIYNLGTRKFVK